MGNQTSAIVHPKDVDSKIRIPIFYGSRTGTAQFISQELNEMAQRRGLLTEVISISEFKDFFTPTCDLPVAIFVISTHGRGDPPHQATEFFHFLTYAKDTPFTNLNYAIFGIGDSRFGDLYCAAADHFQEHMQRLGAQLIGEYVRGDSFDKMQLESSFDKWHGGLWKQIEAISSKAFSPPKRRSRKSGKSDTPSAPSQTPSASTTASNHSKRKFDSNRSHEKREMIVSDTKSTMISEQLGSSHPIAQYYFYSHEVKVTNIEITTRPEKITALVTMTIPEDFDSQDILASLCEILPQNHPDDVKRFATLFNLKLDKWLQWSGDDAPFPTPCTVETALIRYCDITNMPPRSLLQRLIKFVSKENSQYQKVVETDFYKKMLQDYTSFIDFAEDHLSGITMPAEEFFQWCPRLRPRSYSVCSSHFEDEEKFQIYLSLKRQQIPEKTLTNGKKVDSRVQEGVTSSWLINRKPESLNVVLTASTFRLPADPTTPIIFVATGVSIAPFRGFIRHFLAIPQFDRPSMCLLFLGCHTPKTVPFKEEFEEAENIWPDFKYYYAYSRSEGKKVHVQNRIRQQQHSVATLVNDGGSIFVCGGVEMAHEVREAFEEVFGLMRTNATIDTLISVGRYVEDLWI